MFWRQKKRPEKHLLGKPRPLQRLGKKRMHWVARLQKNTMILLWDSSRCMVLKKTFSSVSYLDIRFQLTRTGIRFSWKDRQVCGFLQIRRMRRDCILHLMLQQLWSRRWMAIRLSLKVRNLLGKISLTSGSHMCLVESTTKFLLTQIW